MTISACTVCGLQGPDVESLPGRRTILLTCHRCGRFEISFSLAEDGLPTATPAERAGLMAAIRAATDRGEILVLLSTNWQDFANRYSSLSIPTKLRNLLEYVGRKSDDKGGAQVPVDDEKDYPRFAARDVAEYHWLRQTLVNQGLIGPDAASLTLTAKGWDSFRPVAGRTMGTCFVAMSFEDALTPAYDDGIEPAVRGDCGFSVIRVDREEHNDNINDKIIADLRSAQFVVADFTNHRNGVYFEAGFALGLGRPVIMTCRKDDFKDKVHFDTRPYNHILWSTPAELRERLKDRIKATIVR